MNREQQYLDVVFNGLRRLGERKLSNLIEGGRIYNEKEISWLNGGQKKSFLMHATLMTKII